jgi:multiple sugar transport system ATP-binding protein
MAEIILQNVFKRFKELVAVNDLNLTISDKEFLVLLGPSGCGKTTTLRMISGLELPSSGKILLDGEDVTFKRASQRDIAFVFQLYALYPHLTVFGNISFPLKAQKVKKSKINEEVKRIAEILRIEHILNKKPKELAGGDMQRVALGRAMVRRPKAFLLDEPIGTLDAKFREEMRTELKKLHVDIGATTAYVTHDQVEAMSMGDRIAIMSLGVLQQVGTPDDIYHNPKNLFVANFIGSPGMNLLDFVVIKDANGRAALRLKDEEIVVPINEKIAKIVMDKNELDKVVVLGVRPEEVKISMTEQKDYNKASIFVVETIGSYNIVDIKFGQQIIRARTSASFMPNIGDSAYVGFDMDRISIFDKNTEQSLMS